jgi:hypothetical protein
MRDETMAVVTEIDVLLLGVQVANFPLAVDWYSRLLGRPPDSVVNDDEVMWRTSDTAWIYVLGGRPRAGFGLITLAVADLDGIIEELRSRGIIGEPIEVVGTAGGKATFSDLDGNHVNFVEVAH